MSTDNTAILYGANGYTGRLIAREAVRRGLRPVLAGRNKAAVDALARELNCPPRAFALDTVDAVAAQLAGARAVLHCAGPFSATAATMMDACIRAKTHYLDITGEIDVIETGAARDAQAKAAGVAIIPAVGFDVVPSDCLAALLHAQLPTATHLELAFMAGGGLSPGTAKTSLEGLPRGGRARIDGKITSVPAAWNSREIPFADGARWAVTIPWGDVASAYYSTGIPNIEVYMAMPPGQIRRLRRWRWLLPLLTLGPLQRFARRRIERTVKGPSNAELEASRSSLWGRVADPQGRSVEATLQTPGGYPLTVLTSLMFLEAALAGQLPAGFSTPSRALGAEAILSVPGTTFSRVRSS
jgi:short subunit dehydrogenase-like uncharacterized protein